MKAQPEEVKRSQEQSEPEGATKKRRGETPPQQIRKAKKSTRRRFSAETGGPRIVTQGDEYLPP